MKKEGIIDPAKVSRCALQNAVSIASMILTTECLVTEKIDNKKLDQAEGSMEESF